MKKIIPIILGSVAVVLIVFLVYGESTAYRLCEQRGGVMRGDMCIIDVSESKTGSSNNSVAKLLMQNNIEFHPSNMVVTGGPTFSGDHGCGAVIDNNSEIHWFDVDSRSNAKQMTIHSENPNPCKINWDTCFCNAQTKLAELTTDELSYLSAAEEEQIGKRIKTYFETIPHKISATKFVVGKYNFDLGEQYTEVCGALLSESNHTAINNTFAGLSVYTYFSTAKEGYRLWDFSLSVDSEKLCAISDDAKIFEYEKQE